MSIIIKGMNMPKGEDICLTWRIRRKDLYAVHYQPIRKEDIIEIPTPHGRLVDVNDLKADMRLYESKYCGEQGYITEDDIDDAPTILEVEE